MARARNIKPSFFKNEDLAELAYEARLLFIGTWTLADREGRLEDRPKKIKMEIFPADSLDCNKLLQHLHESKFILRYDLDGKRYIQVIKFLKHQNPHHREPNSVIPPPPESLMLEWLGNGVGPEADDLFKRVEARGSPGASRADSPSLIPDSGSLIPESPSRKPEEKPSAASRRPGNGAARPDTGPTWAAYIAAYVIRWKVEPSRNAEDNAHMLAFVQKVPLDEAPHIASFYVGHNKAWYVENQHPVKSLRMNAVGLRTQWLNQRQVTSSEARQADQTAARGDQARRLIHKHGAA